MSVLINNDLVTTISYFTDVKQKLSAITVKRDQLVEKAGPKTFIVNGSRFEQHKIGEVITGRLYNQCIIVCLGHDEEKVMIKVKSHIVDSLRRHKATAEARLDAINYALNQEDLEVKIKEA